VNEPGPPAAERCPRCGATFHCGAGDAAPCPCTGVALDPATLTMLRRRYAGCLCLRCLVALADQCAPPPVADTRTGLVSQTTPMSTTKSAADK
jgi:hypothetical protein